MLLQVYLFPPQPAPQPGPFITVACATRAGSLSTPLVGAADRTIGRNQETNAGNLVCASLKYAAQTGVVSAAVHVDTFDDMRRQWMDLVSCPATSMRGWSFLSTHLQPAATAVLAANPGLPVVCLENAGGIRVDIPAGNVTLAQVTSLLPFGNK